MENENDFPNYAGKIIKTASEFLPFYFSHYQKMVSKPHYHYLRIGKTREQNNDFTTYKSSNSLPKRLIKPNIEIALSNQIDMTCCLKFSDTSK